MNGWQQDRLRPLECAPPHLTPRLMPTGYKTPVADQKLQHKRYHCCVSSGTNFKAVKSSVKGANLPPSCSGSRARWRWPVLQTGAADARWHAGGPAPPAGTDPARARAASPVRAQGQQGLEASIGPMGVTKRRSNGPKGGVGAQREGRWRQEEPTAGLKGELGLALTATQCH